MFVLVHSPLVGPVTWSLVARAMRERGIQAVVPRIESGERKPPYWQQHARDVTMAIESIAADIPLILVGHSGAGQLLPAIREMVRHDIAGYVFVDAGLPVDGLSRLEAMHQESPEFARQFREALEADTRFPTWSDDDLREVIPDDRLRAQVLDDLRPQSLAFFDEPIPTFDGWPDAPCAYVQLTATYDVFAERARTEGWNLQRIEGGHFHMLVDPGAVATALVRAVEI